MKNVYLVQAEITSGYLSEHYLPFSVGCIWAYAYQFQDIKENFELKDVIWRRDRQKDVLEKIINPDIVGFSTYQWNHQWNLTLAKKIKDKYPNCLIVFGGPSINEDWLVHEFIDVLMFGEGEEAWAKLLRQYINNEPIKRYWKNLRQQSLEDYPSPYTTGFFDKIIADNPDVTWFMMVETNRGCPYHCTFCGWGAEYLNKLKTFSMDRARGELEWASKNNVHWIFVIDANAGILKDRDIELAKLVRSSIEAPGSKVRRITFNHAKNLNERCFEIEKIIRDWSYGLEIAIQSLHPPTLAAIKRDNMGMNDLERSYQLCRKYNIKNYTELVLGLPEETFDSYINGVMKLLELGQHDSIKTYLATVIPNSEMATKEYQEKYGIKLIYPKDLFRTKEERKWDDEDNSHESIAMVCETNTMSRQDFVNCLTYAWMMSQFHYSGYTQIISKYLKYIKGIEFKEYYDYLLKFIETDPLVGPLVKDVREILSSYINYGEVPNNGKWDNVIGLTLSESYGNTQMFENKKKVIDLGIRAAQHFTQIDQCIIDLQYAYIKDEDQTYPYIINSTIDIDRWLVSDCVYEVVKRTPVSHQQDQMYRKYLNKTDINNLHNPFSETFITERTEAHRPVTSFESSIDKGLMY